MSVDLMMPSSVPGFGALNLDGGFAGDMNANAGSGNSTGLTEEVLLCMMLLEQDILSQMQSPTQNSPTSQDEPSGTGSSDGTQTGDDGTTDPSMRDSQLVAMILQDLSQMQTGDDDQGVSPASGPSGSSLPGIAAGPGNTQGPPDTSAPPPSASVPAASSGTAPAASGTGSTSSGTAPASSSAADGLPDHVQFSDQWNTIPFQNRTDQPLTVQLTMGAGQSLPAGVGSNGQFTIPPGGTVNLSFAGNGPGFNFKTTTGDGSAWNQGEVTFSSNGDSHSTAFDVSYIYGANSNMNIYSSDGQSSGYQSNLFANVPADAKAGNWGIAAPLSATSADASGPGAPTNAPAAFLYDTIPKGKGYVGVGEPAESSSYDDASSLMTNGNIAVVFS